MNMHYLLVIVILIRTVSDLLFKYSVNDCSFNSMQDIPKAGATLLKKPVLWLAVILAIAGAMTWTYSLNFFDLSYAYPFLSICFVTIIMGGKLFFKEHIGMYKLVGLGFILVGSFFLILG